MCALNYELSTDVPNETDLGVREVRVGVLENRRLGDYL